MAMGRFHDKRFPGEGDTYRQARDELLAAEIELRKRIEDVAVLRRALPLGGRLKEDYVFEEMAADPSDRETGTRTRFSELFGAGKSSLVIYSFMYAPDADLPCPACTSLLDSLNGGAPHIRDKVSFAVVAKAPVQKIKDWAAERGWRNLRLLSSGGNGYNTDYFAEAPDGAQLPMLNVFRKTRDGIFHSYSTELFHAPAEEGQHPRHMDLIWPYWSVFDLTPEGRADGWFPKLAYD
jgi:predicted dithiol-disulfide oxidoreductase (DUF899 family)